MQILYDQGVVVTQRTQLTLFGEVTEGFQRTNVLTKP